MLIVSNRAWLWKIVTAGSFLIFAVWLYSKYPLDQWIFELCASARNQGIFGVFIYMLIYILATVIVFPCGVLTFGAGLLYGVWGLPLVIFSSCIGASFAFLISRFLVREHIEEFMARRPRTKALKKAIETEGWKFMLLLRVSPLIPFNLNNYFLGTVQVRFLTYLWVTAIGAIPGTALFIYLGAIGQGMNEGQTMKWILFTVGVIATIILVRKTHKKTQEILSNMHDK